VLKQHPEKKTKFFIVWESVLDEDTNPPNARMLSLIKDQRATQYWDPQRALSKQMGEKDEETIVWDWIALYPPGAKWEQPPTPTFSSRPVVKVIKKFEEAFATAP
jgi:hypothetical protein